MAEPEDLLGKADALMARHRPPRDAGGQDAGIPVLDEVVQLRPDGDDLPVLTELVLSTPAGDEQIEALAANIRASLLARLQPEIDALIERRLKVVLSPPVESVLHELRGDLQLTAREVLDDAIHAAVEQELERRRSDG